MKWLHKDLEEKETNWAEGTGVRRWLDGTAPPPPLHEPVPAAAAPSPSAASPATDTPDELAGLDPLPHPPIAYPGVPVLRPDKLRLMAELPPKTLNGVTLVVELVEESIDIGVGPAEGFLTCWLGMCIAGMR